MKPIGETITQATAPRDPWTEAMSALRGDPEANRKAALAITGALSLPAKGAWAVLKADADYAKANRDAAKRTSGLDTVGGNPGGIDMISGMGLPLMAKALRAGDKVADAVPGIRAYHGSPHDFDKFDLSKIGTGEGAQVYGHGLYFAGNEKVAKSYRDALGPLQGRGYSQRDRMRVEVGDKKFELTSEPQVRAWRSLNSAGGWGSTSDAFANARRMRADDPDALRWIDRWEKQGARTIEDYGGRMYEVNIAAKPEQFLDWDKPLRDQGRIADVLRAKVPNDIRKSFDTNVDKGGISGANAYRNYVPAHRFSIRENANHPYTATNAATYDEALKLVGGDKSRVLQINSHNPGSASATLRDAGIPGIKYLDQGSRPVSHLDARIAKIEAMSPKEGPLLEELNRLKAQRADAAPTSNYVLFRDDIINILRKYGIPGAGVAGAGALAGGAPDAMADAIRDKKP